MTISINEALGLMVKRWETVLPVAIHALYAFNKSNNNVLLKTGKDKADLMASVKLEKDILLFKCPETGIMLDLSQYKR